MSSKGAESGPVAAGSRPKKTGKTARYTPVSIVYA